MPMKPAYEKNPSQQKVVIIAGGKGTRLGELTMHVPKPLIPLEGKPLLWYVLTYARQYGFSLFLLKIGYRAEQIQAYMDDGHQFHATVDYFIEQEPLGTAGGLRFLMEEKSPVLILYGDVLSAVNLRKLCAFHHQKKAQATLVVHSSDHPEDSDVVLLDHQQRVKKIIHKPGNANHGTITNAALYLLNPECFSLIPETGTCDFARDLIPELLRKKMKVYGYATQEYIRDIGTTKRLKEAAVDLTEGKIINRVSSVFLDRDGTINVYVPDLHRVEDFKLLPGSAAGIRSLNDAHIPVIVATNQPSVAKGFCDIDTVDAIHAVMQNHLQKAGAYVDAIDYCPHHPEKGHQGERLEYKVTCTCRKPGIGMLHKAQKKYNLDLARSFFVGDTPQDVRTGKNAGCRTILLTSGCPLSGDLGNPDYIMKNLAEAARFICLYNGSTMGKVIREIKEKLPVQQHIMVLIGGCARTGKTVLSQQLKELLLQDKIPTQIVCLDDWLLSPSNGNLINLTAFLSGKTSERETKKAYQPHPDTRVIIIEGAVALDLKSLVDQADICIFKDKRDKDKQDKDKQEEEEGLFIKATWKKAQYIL